MAWSPPALKCRKWLVEQARDYAATRFHHFRDGTQDTSPQIEALEATIPIIVRDAFRVTTEERPGPVLLELPENVAGEECEDITSIPVHPIEIPVGHRAALDGAADMIQAAKRPLIMLGAACSRPRGTTGINAFVRRTQVPFFTTQMGKGTRPAAATSIWAHRAWGARLRP